MSSQQNNDWRTEVTQQAETRRKNEKESQERRKRFSEERDLFHSLDQIPRNRTLPLPGSPVSATEAAKRLRRVHDYMGDKYGDTWRTDLQTPVCKQALVNHEVFRNSSYHHADAAYAVFTEVFEVFSSARSGVQKVATLLREVADCEDPGLLWALVKMTQEADYLLAQLNGYVPLPSIPEPSIAVSDSNAAKTPATSQTKRPKAKPRMTPTSKFREMLESLETLPESEEDIKKLTHSHNQRWGGQNAPGEKLKWATIELTEAKQLLRDERKKRNKNTGT